MRKRGEGREGERKGGEDRKVKRDGGGDGRGPKRCQQPPVSRLLYMTSTPNSITSLVWLLPAIELPGNSIHSLYSIYIGIAVCFPTLYTYIHTSFITPTAIPTQPLIFFGTYTLSASHSLYTYPSLLLCVPNFFFEALLLRALCSQALVTIEALGRDNGFQHLL